MTINKLGILIPHMGRSQFSFQLTRELNLSVINNHALDICVFVENIVQIPFQQYFPIMSMYYAYNYKGPLVATSLTTAKKLINLPLRNQKFFYIWDLEWTQIKDKKYMELAEIYKNEDVNLLARSETHARLIEKAWDRDVLGIVPDFRIKELTETINGTK